jgi:hypothetical protein
MSEKQETVSDKPSGALADWILGYLANECSLDMGCVSPADFLAITNAIHNHELDTHVSSPAEGAEPVAAWLITYPESNNTTLATTDRDRAAYSKDTLGCPVEPLFRAAPQSDATLREQLADLTKANQLLHRLMENREAELAAEREACGLSIMRYEAAETENAKLHAQLAVRTSLLKECLEDYGHPKFTDRHRMADRIRSALSSALGNSDD